MQTVKPQKGFAKPLWVFAIAFIVIVVAVTVAHVSLGLTAVVVDGRSMLPTLQSGDLVFVIKAAPSQIKVGDVIVYRFTGYFYGYYLQNALIIHRVIYVYNHGNTLCFVTKGDNNPIPDPGYPQYCGLVEINGTPVSGVPYNDVVGVVVGGQDPIAIPYIGSLSLELRPQPGVT